MPRYRLALGALALGILVIAGTALALPPNPASNIPITIPAVCNSSPTGADCENAAIAILQNDQAILDQQQGTHFGPYQLPADFVSLTPGCQLLILINDIRAQYNEQTVLGLNKTADDGAMLALTRPPEAGGGDTDPPYPPGLVGGVMAGSNVAWGWPNVVFAFIFWMYDDGPGSGNAACAAQGGLACWGHRRTIIQESSVGNMIMGVATGTDTLGRPAYAMVMVLERLTVPLEYTWQQALKDGAGPAGPPPLGPYSPKAKFRLAIKVKPDKSCGGVSPAVSSKGYTPGTKVILSAKAKPGSGCTFVSWQGAAGCSTKPTCEFIMSQFRSATLVFRRKTKTK